MWPFINKKKKKEEPKRVTSGYISRKSLPEDEDYIPTYSPIWGSLNSDSIPSTDTYHHEDTPDFQGFGGGSGGGAGSSDSWSSNDDSNNSSSSSSDSGTCDSGSSSSD
jgi:hypothetical protein